MVAAALIVELAAISYPLTRAAVVGPQRVVIDNEWKNSFFRQQGPGRRIPLTDDEIAIVKQETFLRLREAYSGYGRTVVYFTPPASPVEHRSC